MLPVKRKALRTNATSALKEAFNNNNKKTASPGKNKKHQITSVTKKKQEPLNKSGKIG